MCWIIKHVAMRRVTVYLLEWLSQNTSKGFQLRVEKGNIMTKYKVKNRQYGILTAPQLKVLHVRMQRLLWIGVGILGWTV